MQETEKRIGAGFATNYILFVATCSLATLVLAASVPQIVRYMFGCMNPTCYDLGYEITSSIDYSKQPCDDFYTYVCTGWKQRNALYPNLFANLQQRVALAVVKNLVLTDTETMHQEANDKVAIMFQACAKVAFNARDHSDHIQAFLSKFGLEYSRQNEKRKTVDLFDVLVALSLNHGIPVLFQLSIDVCFKTPGKYMLHFSLNPYIMEWFVLRSSLIQHGQLFHYFRMFGVAATGKPLPQDVIERLVILDNRIMAAVIPTLDSRPDLDLEYLTFEALANMTEPHITLDDWLTTINRYLPQEAQQTKDDEMFVMNRRVIKLLAMLLGHAKDSHTLRTYLWWQVTRHLAPVASFPLSQAQFPGQSSTLLTLGYMLGRCYMDADAAMPYAFADAFVERWLPPNVIEKVRRLVHFVRNITVDAFQNTSWMDNSTRSEAKRKMTTLKEIVGRPVRLSQKNDINKHYKHIPPMKGIYLDMFLESRAADLAYSKTLLGTKNSTDYQIVNIPLTMVNAFYVPIYHVMVIPAAILFSPFYTRDAPPSVNYGSLGHVVGHEITHVFDPDMGLLDETGVKKNWWSNDSRTKFEDRLQCLKDMYNKLPWANGVNYGDKALGENFADCGGMQKVFKAYKQHRKEHPSLFEQKISGLETYTDEQLFFISSCFKWCSNDDKQSVGWYSPPRMRCNVPLMNMEEFSKAFSCPAGSAMNPAKRCNFM